MIEKKTTWILFSFVALSSISNEGRKIYKNLSSICNIYWFIVIGPILLCRWVEFFLLFFLFISQNYSLCLAELYNQMLTIIFFSLAHISVWVDVDTFRSNGQHTRMTIVLIRTVSEWTVEQKNIHSHTNQFLLFNQKAWCWSVHCVQHDHAHVLTHSPDFKIVLILSHSLPFISFCKIYCNKFTKWHRKFRFFYEIFDGYSAHMHNQMIKLQQILQNVHRFFAHTHHQN